VVKQISAMYHVSIRLLARTTSRGIERSGRGPRSEAGRFDRVLARLRGPWVDRRLAAGTAAPGTLLRARSRQLSSERHRRTLARSLERLCMQAQLPPVRLIATIDAPCPDQVADALPLMEIIAVRLRSAEPLDARGIAQLSELLADGAGPCYRSTRPGALRIALHDIMQSLDVSD
jgi:hypothetical protein